MWLHEKVGLLLVTWNHIILCKLLVVANVLDCDVVSIYLFSKSS